MKHIFSSASRVILILIVITLCVITGYVVISNADKSEVVTGIIGVFSMVVTSVVTFYFKDQKTSVQTERETPINHE